MQTPENDGTYTQDFLDWFGELEACLPMVARWLSGCDDIVRLKWQDLLAPVDLAFAKERINRMLREQDKAITESTHWQAIPSMIRSAWYREQNTHGEEWRNNLRPLQPISKADPSMGEHFAKIIAIRKEYEDIPGIWKNKELMQQWRDRRRAVVQDYCDELDSASRRPARMVNL
jgi:hypothetical protein